MRRSGCVLYPRRFIKPIAIVLLRGCVPGNSVHPRSATSSIFRHSPDGKKLAAERVGEQMLQGSHLVPSALLRCLYDTRLEPTHIRFYGPPVDILPLELRDRVFVANRTNAAFPSYSNLHCFLN